MNNEFRTFLERIEFNENIEQEQKNQLINFIKANLSSKVRIFNNREYRNLEIILEELNYDPYMFERLLTNAYIIKNTIGRKNGFSPSIPKIEYVYCVHKIFKDLNMDLVEYDENFEISNVAIARTAYKMSLNEDVLNNEITFVDLTKKICERYYDPHEVTKTSCIVLKLLHRVDMGLKEFNGKYKNVVTSEEFISMFRHYAPIDDLHFSDLIKEFYPIFENELFSLIKEAVKSYQYGKPDTEYVFNRLNIIKKRREEFTKKKEAIVSSISRIELDTRKKTKDIFSDLIQSIGSNKNISVNVNKSIVNNIDNVFKEYNTRQRIFVEGQLTNFFDNCSNFVNDLIITDNGKDGIDELISELVGECKDFFIEYDSKKFKEIVDYILENTDLSVEDLKGVGKKCAAFFKDADVKKLKEINKSLNEFKEYINKTFKDNEIINENIFDSILLNNPDLLLKNNNINDVLAFLKGEISLDDKGYHYRNLMFEKDFLSFDFYKKIIDGDYRILFESSLEKFINNLNYLEGKCGIWDIDFKKFRFNEDTIYSFLENDLYENGSKSLDCLVEIFNGEDFKKVIEINPELLVMPKKDLEIIVKRCILNENLDYGFYDLLSSELYYYRIKEFKEKKAEELELRSFKYIDLDIDKSRKFDAEEVLTSSVLDSQTSFEVMELYEERKKKIKELDGLLLDLEKEDSYLFSLNPIVERIVKQYNSVYGNVPYVSFKNVALDFINTKKENYEYRISDEIEELESKKAIKMSLASKKNDSILALEKISEIIDTIVNDDVKRDLMNFSKQFRSKHKIRNELKEKNIDEEIEQIETNLQIFDREVEYLDYLLTVMDFKEDSLQLDYEAVKKKTFDISTLANNELSNKLEDNQLIEKLLQGQNLIIFSSSIDLNDIPNDKDFVDKVYKFLGDTDFSIRSQQFMKNNTLNEEFVEKYPSPRNGIWSRRENRTPVRIYFIPIHTKYFTCYYVIGVNYKDHAHLDGGCSSDDVYKRRLNKAKELESMINQLSVVDAIRFINEENAIYEAKMQPIINKIENYEKKKNIKK